MEKMSATFYVLTILGTLLVPMVSMDEPKNQNTSSEIQNTSSDIQNTSSDIQNTSFDIQNTSFDTQNTSLINKTHSGDVDNVTNAFDPNITNAENSTTLSTQVPPTKGNVQ
ncbi:protein let-653 isoform X1 [Tachysurus ichikawai]